MKYIATCLFTYFLVFHSIAHAHVDIENTTPTNHAKLTTSPETLSLVYSGEVRIVKLKLTDSSGEKVDLGFKRSADASRSFSWQLPALKKESYRVNWVVMGKDGHKMKGLFDFVVE
jgi:methionine-rich copper-binding protein CopC